MRSLSVDSTQVDMRRAVDAMHAGIPMPDDINVEPVQTDRGPALWVSAPGAAANRLIIHYHGGAYVASSPENLREYAYRLSRAADARVLIPSYRQAPEHPYPAAVEDAIAAFRWASRRCNPARIALSGNSCGAALCLAVAISQRDAGAPSPAALAMTSAYLDLDGGGESQVTNAERDCVSRPDALRHLAQLYLQGRRPTETVMAAPLSCDLSDLPPMYVAVGGHETLLDDSRRLVRTVIAAGGKATLEVAAEMQHDYMVWGDILPEARGTFQRMGRFIRDQIPLRAIPGQGPFGAAAARQ